MVDDPSSILTALYAAWAAQDIEMTLIYCSDDIRYTVHSPEGISGVGGVMQGKASLRAYLTAVCGVWDFVEIMSGDLTPNVADDPELVRESMRFRAVHRLTGLPLDGRKRHVWRVHNGRVVECDEFQDAMTIKTFLEMARWQVDARN